MTTSHAINITDTRDLQRPWSLARFVSCHLPGGFNINYSVFLCTQELFHNQNKCKNPTLPKIPSVPLIPTKTVLCLQHSDSTNIYKPSAVLTDGMQQSIKLFPSSSGWTWFHFPTACAPKKIMLLTQLHCHQDPDHLPLYSCCPALLEEITSQKEKGVLDKDDPQAQGRSLILLSNLSSPTPLSLVSSLQISQDPPLHSCCPPHFPTFRQCPCPLWLAHRNPSFAFFPAPGTSVRALNLCTPVLRRDLPSSPNDKPFSPRTLGSRPLHHQRGLALSTDLSHSPASSFSPLVCPITYQT